jgi:hypothetical protein
MHTNEPIDFSGCDPQQPEHRGVEDRVDRKAGPDWTQGQNWILENEVLVRQVHPATHFEDAQVAILGLTTL